MSIFKTQLFKNIKQEETTLKDRWEKLKLYQQKIDFIKTIKEEKFQDTFLKDIFENCLGYTLDSTNPNNFNLERERKNITDSKKADGVIHINGKIVGIIELKGQDTPNLDKKSNRKNSPIEQAFGYLTSHDSKFAKYVFVSNFNELRFYIRDRINYEKFNLFTMNFEEFKKFHYLLSFESIQNDLPIKLKEKSSNQEKQISDELYKDYSTFNLKLFDSIIKNNAPHIDKIKLLRLTQKLCDRIIFILFAEDRGLLPLNTIKTIRDKHNEDMFGNSIYDYYKIYFNAIDKSNEKINIPKYNGGLFAKDDELDNLIIDNHILDVDVQKLSNYDFESDVSVNILGHIFEQSLTDLEEIQSSILNNTFDKTKTKRKKDGAFYTPEYITKYIIDNTLKKICVDKKTELNLLFIDVPKNKSKLLKSEKETLKNIYLYREFLLNLKIIDIAVGSGAFLNQALEFLISEHSNLDEIRRIYENEELSLYDIESKILENNLYGVDINEDAVEIAKLSLWLRTASKGRELKNLNERIKCGNSLIDDKSVRINAFNWEREFPEVFEKGGFDVIVGNPPYVSYQSNLLDKSDIEYFKNTYITPHKIYDLYGLFIEKSIKLLNNKGRFSFICPSTLLQNDSFSLLREYISKNINIDKFIFCSDGVFENAVVPTIMFIFDKEVKNETIEILEANNTDIYMRNIINYDDFINDSLKGFNISIQNQDKNIIDKAFLDATNLENYLEIREAIKTGDDKKFISDLESDVYNRKLVTGKEASRYKISGYKYFNFNVDELKRPTKEEYYLVNKLFIRRVGKNIEVAYDENGYFATHVLYVGLNKSNILNLKTIMCLMNSSFYNYLHSKMYPPKGDIFPEIRIGNLRSLPVNQRIIENNDSFILYADDMISLQNQIIDIQKAFLNEISDEKIPKKLENFYLLDFETFIKELTKYKKIKFKDKLEERNFKNIWKNIFKEDSTKIKVFIKNIDELEAKINTLVFDCFNITKDEIAIINQSINKEIL